MISKHIKKNEATTPPSVSPEMLAKKRNEWAHKQLLSTITDVIYNYDGAPRLDGNAADYINRIATPRRHAIARPVRVGRFNDGATIFFTTKEPLSDRAHSLLLPIKNVKDDLLYTRTSINIDSQAMESPSLNLRGLEQVTEENIASALQYCLGALTVESAYQWQNALSLENI